jgi:hypothetical protein
LELGAQGASNRDALPPCDAPERAGDFCLAGPAPTVVGKGNDVPLVLGCRPQHAGVRMEATIVVVSNAEPREVPIRVACEGVAGPLPRLVVCLPGDAPPYGVGPGCVQPPPDAMRMDFEAAPIGRGEALRAELWNLGDGPLTLLDTRIESAAAFSLATPTTRREVPPGAWAPLAVTYTPVDGREDVGTVTLDSDDPAQPRVVVQLAGQGNHAPVADAGDDRESEPLATVTLDGSASHDPDGDVPLVYHWSFAANRSGVEGNDGRPEDSRGQIKSVVETPECQAAESPFPVQCRPWEAKLWLDLAGTWYVELRVTDTVGLTNVDPEIIVIEAVPPQDLHVQLVWDNFQSDLDLHLTREGDALFSGSDCHFRNCSPNRPGGGGMKPDWCTADGGGTGPDDPSLDIDDTSGYGPENINIDAPCADRYHVNVHYWSTHGHPLVLSDATLRVYCNRVLRGVFDAALTVEKQMWHVAVINWPGCEIEEVGVLGMWP